MNNQNLQELVHDLNLLIMDLKFEEALQTFYDEDIISMENAEASTKGLQAYIDAGQTFLNNISNYKAQLLAVMIGKDVTASHWHYTFDHKLWGHWDKEQISVQCWKNGKITREVHTYN